MCASLANVDRVTVLAGSMYLFSASAFQSKESPARLDAARKAFEQHGAKLKDLVCGQYDAIVITEALDDTAVAKVSLALGSRGNMRTETFRAFTEEEFRKIVSALP